MKKAYLTLASVVLLASSAAMADDMRNITVSGNGGTVSIQGNNVRIEGGDRQNGGNMMQGPNGQMRGDDRGGDRGQQNMQQPPRDMRNDDRGNQNQQGQRQGMGEQGQNMGPINLMGKITASYKVTLKWTPYNPADGEELLGYKVVLSYNDKEVSGSGDKVISVESSKNTIDDWNAKKGTNYYKVFAVTSNGEVGSNPILIAMDGNGAYDFSLMGGEKRQDGRQGQQNMQQSQSRDNMRPNMQDNRQGQNMQPAGEPNPMQFIASGFSSTELEAMKKSMRDAQEKAISLVKNAVQTSGDVQAAIDQGVEILKAAFDNMSKYVDESKKDQFNKFVENRINMFKENSKGRKEMKDTRQEFKEDRQEMRQEMRNDDRSQKPQNMQGQNMNGQKGNQNPQLSKYVMDSISKALDKALTPFFAKVEQLSTEQQKTLLTKVMEKVKTKLDSVQNTKSQSAMKVVATLQMLMERIQDKLDDLNGNGTDSTLTDVLNVQE